MREIAHSELQDADGPYGGPPRGNARLPEWFLNLYRQEAP